ncbi:Leucine-rich repeat-containing protein [Artemisia annua]|uniref:Leucine-rich repeat-containing protein n=1 Tax=Artemisia annua TaxID=35608 RepID=A0A2U1LKM7_ARTAN|nr:Leucine-rich repeat-containing protein [Artemisia annua]
MLQGTIHPLSSLFNLTHLTHLQLSYNRLNGTLPSWLFTSPSLESLSLSGNMFSGNVPFDSFASPSLKELYLSNNNQLGGQIDVQTFPQLTNLTDLYLSNNNFSGELELDSLLLTLTNLYSLDLSHSGFSVTTKNTNHYVNPGVTYLGLASCKLKSNLIEGPFPPSICNMSKLQFLDMSNNSFGGLIPQCFGNIIPSISMIDLGNNSFQGTIPNVYGGCRYLEGLILNGNQLRGEVPSSLSKCQWLKVLPDQRICKIEVEQSEALLLFKQNLSSINDTSFDSICSDSHPIMMNWNTNTDCCNWNGITCDYSTGDIIGIDVSCGMLQGTIHPNTSLFNLLHLQTLSLANNNFSGSLIPHEIGRFSNSLTHLNLSRCWFSGQVPPDITLLHKLVSLDLSLNDFALNLGPYVFIDMFRLFTNLEELSLQEVNISSVLPATIDITSLKLLNLGYTEMKGILPRYIFNLIHSVETLDLICNSFTGDIPLEISGNLTHLTYLDLSINKLNGTLPSWLFTSPSLEYLNLTDNMLSGNVPFESFALPSLETFDLSSNHFSGEWELDTLLSSLTNLESLDLSYNNFSVTSKNAYQYVNLGFRTLRLASCKLKVFPNSFRGMKQLECFDGVIPKCLGNITSSLVMMDLGINLFQGTIPNVFEDCRQLEGLILNGNQLEGKVPSSLSRCQWLRVLDFGNNHLNGTFPGWLEDHPNLQALLIKSNNFHGHIQPSSSIEPLFPSLRVLELSHDRIVGQLPAKYIQRFNSMKNVVKSSTTPKYLSMGSYELHSLMMSAIMELK